MFRFVVVMVEAGQAKRLVNYPYHGFKAEVVSVLEFKARNSDLRQNQLKNYYNLLFAFHVQNKVRSCKLILYKPKFSITYFST